MHADEDYESSIEEEENDYSNFYNGSYEEVKESKSNKGGSGKALLIIIILLLVLIVLVAILIFVFKKNQPVEFNLGLENITGDAWAKESVTVNVDIPDETKLKSVKYTINCNDNCEYADVVDKKIVISNSGTSNVTVVVTSEDNVENKKNIVVKIDNVAPELILSPRETNIKSITPMTVCAICTDKESGCKQERVCQDYTKTVKDQVLVVMDNAGNTTSSSKFNVTIGEEQTTPTATPTPTVNLSCSLSVNSSGLVTATHKNADAYHGFSSSYSGSNETSKQLNINKNDATEIVKYYVKNSSGKTASCSIEVKSSSCNCVYRGDNGKCYKTHVKTINDPSSKECANATRKTNTNCSFYKDEGLTCTYTKVMTK